MAKAHDSPEKMKLLTSSSSLSSPRALSLLLLILTAFTNTFRFSHFASSSDNASNISVVDAFVFTSHKRSCVTTSIERRNASWLLARPKKKATISPSNEEEATATTTIEKTTISPSQNKKTATSSIPAITERMIAITQNPNIAIVIDMENVRGKTGFELDHADFLDRLMVWTSLRNHALGRTIIVVDHGSRSTAHLLNGHREHQIIDNDSAAEAALCVSFAGPHVKADDVIARDVRWLLNDSTTKHVVVITADQELMWRCRSAVPRLDSSDGSGGVGNTAAAPNSILRRFADGNVNVQKGGGNGKQQSKRKGKKSRAVRKLRILQSQEEEQSDDEEEEEEIEDEAGDEVEEQTDTTTNDASSTANNTTIEDTGEQQTIDMPTVEIIAPQRFLEDLEQAMYEWLYQQEEHALAEHHPDNDTPIPIKNIPIPTPVTTLQNLFQLRGQILSLESSLRKKCSLHKRHTMTGELRKCKVEWREILSTFATTTTDDDDGQVVDGDKKSSPLASTLAWSLSSTISSWDNDDINDDNAPPLSPLPSSSLAATTSTSSMSWEQLPPKEQEKLLLRWGKRRGRQGTRREKTEDRIVLAERLRRQLELILEGSNDESSLDEVTASCANGREASLTSMYAKYINSMCN